MSWSSGALARVTVRRTQSCPEQEVTLKGRGVNSCLTFRADPPDDVRATSLFFGYVTPTIAGPGTVTFFDLISSAPGRAPVRLDEVTAACNELLETA